ncbi:MAG: DUF1254 domain-containing protein [Pseudomonadota bacterium]|nr:DUF1254 domain-containing protein [Pseudomonadota bacterium]
MKPTVLVLLLLSQACLSRRAPAPEEAPTVPPETAPAPATNVEEARAAAVDAYIYGYPLVTMDLTRRVSTNVAEPTGDKAPMGQFANLRKYPDASFRTVTAPNADTLYSAAWLDLSEQPMVLSLPAAGNRYYLMPMLSAWTEVFQAPGTRTTGTDAQTYLLTGPGWSGEVPEGMTRVEAPTNMVWILGRTYSSGTTKDYAAVHKLQDAYRLVPLDAWGKPYTPAPGTVDPNLDMTTAVRDQVNAMSGEEFFGRLATLLEKNPPAAADGPVLERMAKIGVVPGQPFAPPDETVRGAIADAPQRAIEQIRSQKAEAGRETNGWTIVTDTGKYGTDYMQRAFIAATGLGANLPEDAVYPVATVDAEGSPLTGENAYVLRFAKGETPPAKGFWSVTLYDPELFFVDNPLNRYSISPRQDLKYNADGSLELYVQNVSPGKALESNWLPAPAGDFQLMMRLYWPDQSVLDGSWAPPAVERVEQRGPS